MRAIAILLLATAAIALPSGRLPASPPLPTPDQVFIIAMKPQARQLPDFFTPDSLLAALPRMKPAYTLLPVGRKIASQSGVIVLKGGEVLFWRSYRRDLIAIETALEPIVYMIVE